jgi:transcriptional regulator with XRE-family HTH domain
VTLGERIASRRRALGWSQNELARRADVNHPTLYKIEAGQRANPSIAIIVRIAQALGTTAETLLGFERDEMRLAVEANDLDLIVEVRSVGANNAKVRDRARALVTSALERAGATVRDVTQAGEAGAARSKPAEARLAAGGLALVDELQAVRRRLDALEAWRRSQEPRTRKRATH